MPGLDGLDKKTQNPQMKLHVFNLVMLMTAPAAKGLTLMRHWRDCTGNSS